MLNEISVFRTAALTLIDPALQLNLNFQVEKFLEPVGFIGENTSAPSVVVVGV